MFYPDFTPFVAPTPSSEWTSLMLEDALKPSEPPTATDSNFEAVTSKFWMLTAGMTAALLMTFLATLIFGAVKATEAVVELQQEYSLMIQNEIYPGR